MLLPAWLTGTLLPAYERKGTQHHQVGQRETEVYKHECSGTGCGLMQALSTRMKLHSSFVSAAHQKQAGEQECQAKGVLP